MSSRLNTFNTLNRSTQLKIFKIKNWVCHDNNDNSNNNRSSMVCGSLFLVKQRRQYKICSNANRWEVTMVQCDNYFSISSMSMSESTSSLSPEDFGTFSFLVTLVEDFRFAPWRKSPMLVWCISLGLVRFFWHLVKWSKKKCCYLVKYF